MGTIAMRLTGRQIFLAAALAAVAHAPLRAESPTVSTVAEYPHGTFLENLHRGPDGTLIATSYFARSLLRIDEDGAAVVASLDVHPVGIITRAHDIIVSAHGKPFTEGPAFTSTNQILVLDRAGRLLRRVPVPEARFLNGLVEIAPGIVLVADSAAGRIWRFDSATARVTPFLADPALTVDPARAEFPGANGLKLRAGRLYISNSSRRTIHSVALRGGKPAGSLRLEASGPVDDFAFLPGGDIVAATHLQTLRRIAPGGSTRDLMASGCDSCTSVDVSPVDGSLTVLTTGDLASGGTKPARILRVSGIGRAR